MAYLNEVLAATVAEWLENFDGCPNNIFDPFQDNAIDFSLQAYEALSADNLNHINIYFGLDSNENPKMIAVGPYLLDDYDGEETSGFADILADGKIYELYADTTITLALAQQYAAKWKTENSSSNMFKYSFLLPRPNFIKLFLEDEANPVRIFFGIDEENDLKVMQKDPNAGSGAIVFNSGSPCPSLCAKVGLI